MLLHWKKKKAPREQSIASHPVYHDLSTSGVRVTETGGIHKSLNPCNEIPHGQQRWRGEKMWIFSICCGLYCLAERTVPCAETARTCKSLENGFYILPPFFWLHPSPLTNVLGSQGATVLLSGPFPFFTPLKCKQLPRCSPPPPSVLWNWMYLTFLRKKLNKQWLKVFRFSGLLNAYKEDLFAFVFSFFSVACKKFASRMIYPSALAMRLWQFSVEITIIWQTMSDNDAAFCPK